jgi:asparagine synthase (glutamine-hydrolysing)
MISPDGRWVLSYNGEVYNHEELRTKLCREWAFRSRSDTETVLAALALHGPLVLEQMVGMWALALWDAWEQQLLLARDRYGQKPLYWRKGMDGALRFASEIKPLLEEGERPEVYAPALAEYLATGNYGHLGERTFFRDIRSFPPAHWAYVHVGDARPQLRRYWSLPRVAPKDRLPYDQTARRKFRETFEEAVSSQLMSDVPLGVTLSGGLDSSAVVGAMVAASGGHGDIPVFTAQAPETAYDETAYVEAVAAHWPGRLQLKWIKLERVSLAHTLERALRVQEEPFGDPSIIAHGMLMDAARASGVPVILGGQGGDELLFGYPHMRDALMSAWLRAGKWGEVLAETREARLSGALYARIGLAAALPTLEHVLRHRSRLRRRGWLSPDLQAASRDKPPHLAEASDSHAVWTEVVERSALPHLTHYDDRNGMARSIEGRMPFLDHRLAECIVLIDQQALVSGGQMKRILRDACADLLPPLVLARRDKIGFYTPLREMLRADLAWVRRTIGDDLARALNIYDVDAIQGLVEVCTSPNTRIDSVLCVWRALSVRVWAEMFQTAPLMSV